MANVWHDFTSSPERLHIDVSRGGLVSDLLEKIASDRLYKGVLDEAT